MSAIVNGEFHLNETWILLGVARDYRSQPHNLTGSTVKLKVATPSGNVVFEANANITNAASGQYEFFIEPSDQDLSGIETGHYRYEVKVEFSSGRSSVQNTGTIRVQPSLFSDDS